MPLRGSESDSKGYFYLLRYNIPFFTFSALKTALRASLPFSFYVNFLHAFIAKTYIEISFLVIIKDEKKDENNVDLKNVSEESDEPSSRVSYDSDILEHATAFVSVEDVKKIVEGELHLVTESEILGKNMVERQTIKKIKGLDFVKAISSESLFESITFDPSNESFSYTNTNEKIPYEEACRKFTKSIVEDILAESEYNANGWIQPLNLYDSETNTYIFIETKKD